MSLAKVGFLVLLAGAVAQAQLGTSGIPASSVQTQRIAMAAPNSQARVVPTAAPRAVSAAALLPVQSKNPKELGVGKLLVASRGLGDPNFTKTVILLVQFDAEGVVGLILNRRTEMPISQVIEGIKGAKDRADPVYLGGPVDLQVILGLRKSQAKIEGAKQICDQVYQISSKAQMEQIMSDKVPPTAVHVYVGYAGWTKDQLRKEMEMGGWFVFPGDAETVFSADPESLWEQMIRKTELQFARNETARGD